VLCNPPNTACIAIALRIIYVVSFESISTLYYRLLRGGCPQIHRFLLRPIIRV
jgi:hypothetical protein